MLILSYEKNFNRKTAIMKNTDGNTELDTGKGTLKFDEPMSRHCSWHAGGPAKQYFEPANIDQLGKFLNSLDPDEEIFWLGLGSNLLVRDGGFDGTVISIKNVFNNIEITGTKRIRAGSGMTCARVARFSAGHGLTGAEFLAGIPGTMGGALAMNAGAFGSETWDIVTGVITIDRSGNQREWTRDEVITGYRYTGFKDDICFVSADLELSPDHEDQAHNKIRQLLALRSESQPVGLASCGSVFCNPGNDYAARLIDACQLKGTRIGGAVVSEKHANFIINSGNATATDIEALINQVKETVKQQHGIDLKTEVRIIGSK